MSYRIRGAKPAYSMCVSRQNLVMALWYAFKFFKWGMKVTIEKQSLT